MAHMLATTAEGKAAMAYVGETPWHGLGQKLTDDAPLEVWAKESGLDFQLNTADVHYKTSPDNVYAMDVFTGKRVM